MSEIIQRPFGPFFDYDVFNLRPKGQATRFNAPYLFRFALFVKVGEEIRLGGIDDMPDLFKTEVDDNGDPILPDDAFGAASYIFTGVVKVDDRNALSDRGVAMLRQSGAKLSVLDDKEGSILVKIKATYYSYEIRAISTTENNGAWVTSFSGSRENPFFLRYKIATTNWVTYERSRIHRERFWWLEFVRETCKAKNTVAVKKRTVDWLVKNYQARYAVHNSGVEPRSDGPCKRVHTGEIYLALARHAEFLKDRLAAQNPRPIHPTVWNSLIKLYKRSGLTDVDFNDDGNEDDQSDEEMDDDRLPDPWETPHIPDAPNNQIDSNQSVALSVEDLGHSLSTLTTSESTDTVEEDVVIHHPHFTNAYTYRCPFERSQGSHCDFFVDLLHPTEDDIMHLENEELRRFTRKRDIEPRDLILPEVLGMLIHDHISEHEGLQSAIPYFHGKIEVVIDLTLRPIYITRIKRLQLCYQSKSNSLKWSWRTKDQGSP